MRRHRSCSLYIISNNYADGLSALIWNNNNRTTYTLSWNYECAVSVTQLMFVIVRNYRLITRNFGIWWTTLRILGMNLILCEELFQICILFASHNLNDVYYILLLIISWADWNFHVHSCLRRCALSRLRWKTRWKNEKVQHWSYGRLKRISFPEFKDSPHLTPPSYNRTVIPLPANHHLKEELWIRVWAFEFS